MEVMTYSEAVQLFERLFAEKEKHFNENTIPFLAGFATGVALTAIQYSHQIGEWNAETTKRFFEMMGNDKEYDPYVKGKEFIDSERGRRHAVGTNNSRG